MLASLPRVSASRLCLTSLPHVSASRRNIASYYRDASIASLH
ncbi:MAG: hypothetical protein VSS75_019085 [Candidatus Parabeggiatoa sp.]|nr:hypothetical protein [Candidatus Parabeggiatoa sp.]